MRGRRRVGTSIDETPSVFGFGAMSARDARARAVDACRACLSSARSSLDPLLDLGCACARTWAHAACALDAHGARLEGVARGRASDRDWTLTWTCAPCDACGCEFSRDAVSALARRAVATLAVDVARADGDAATRGRHGRGTVA